MITATQMLLEPLPHLGLWRTWSTHRVRFESGEHVVIPPGFYTDLASVPKWAWAMLSCGPSNLSVAGVVHDFICRKDARLLTEDGDRRVISFERSLGLMSEAMRDTGIEASDRWKVISALKVNPVEYWQKLTINWLPEGIRA